MYIILTGDIFAWLQAHGGAELPNCCQMVTAQGTLSRWTFVMPSLSYPHYSAHSLSAIRGRREPTLPCTFPLSGVSVPASAIQILETPKGIFARRKQRFVHESVTSGGHVVCWADICDCHIGESLAIRSNKTTSSFLLSRALTIE